MKQFLIFFMTLLSINLFGQTRANNIFKKTEYNDGRSVYRETFDTIKADGQKIDVYLIRNHFDIPYYLPDAFTDSRYKRETISVWRDNIGKKDFQKNWENTYTYDNLSRVINYTYSGCFICSNMPYNYSVTYNTSGQVSCIKNIISEGQTYQLFYNNGGNIKRFDYYLYDKLQIRITLLE